MVKKSLWLRVQRYFPKGSGIQQPGKSRVFKNPYSKNTNRTSHFGQGTLWHNNMGTYGKFIKKLNSIFGGVFKFWFPGEAEQAVKVWEACQSGKLG